MKKEYLKPEAEYLDLCVADELANIDLGMSGVWDEVEDPFV